MSAASCTSAVFGWKDLQCRFLHHTVIGSPTYYVISERHQYHPMVFVLLVPGDQSTVISTESLHDESCGDVCQPVCKNNWQAVKQFKQPESLKGLYGAKVYQRGSFAVKYRA